MRMTIAQAVYSTSMQVQQRTPSYSVAIGFDAHREILFITACLVERLCQRKLLCNATSNLTIKVLLGQ